MTNTAKYFGCCRETVKKVCEYYKIPKKSVCEINKKQYGKAVNMLSISTNEIIKTFASLKEASLFCLGDYSGRTHIADVVKGRRKTAYGYK